MDTSKIRVLLVDDQRGLVALRVGRRGQEEEEGEGRAAHSRQALTFRRLAGWGWQQRAN